MCLLHPPRASAVAARRGGRDFPLLNGGRRPQLPVAGNGDRRERRRQPRLVSASRSQLPFRAQNGAHNEQEAASVGLVTPRG